MSDPPIDDRRECPNCGTPDGCLVHRSGPLEARHAQTKDLLRELSEYFDKYADVTDSDCGVAEVPNEAMEWKQRIDSVLRGEYV